MSRSRVLMRWLPVVILALVLISQSMAAGAAPVAVPMLGFTPTPTHTPTPTPTPTSPPDEHDFECDPAITKRAEPTGAEPGDEVTFVIEVTNRGQEGAINCQVIDEIPPCFEILEVTTTQGTVRIEGQKVTVDIGVVGQDFVVTIVIHTRVREDTPTPLTVENVALFRSDNCDDPTASAIVTIVGPPLPVTGGLSTWWMVAACLGTGLVALSLALSKRNRG